MIATLPLRINDRDPATVAHVADDDGFVPCDATPGLALSHEMIRYLDRRVTVHDRLTQLAEIDPRTSEAWRVSEGGRHNDRAARELGLSACTIRRLNRQARAFLLAGLSRGQDEQTTLDYLEVVDRPAWAAYVLWSQGTIQERIAEILDCSDRQVRRLVSDAREYFEGLDERRVRRLIVAAARRNLDLSLPEPVPPRAVIERAEPPLREWAPEPAAPLWWDAADEDGAGLWDEEEAS